MNYYEELLISKNAELFEIQKSYKRLTRLLHPDTQQDPQLRKLAEAQMKRLHEIVAVLSDPHSRVEYDASLNLNSSPNPHAPAKPEPLNRTVTLLIGIACGIFIGYHLNYGSDKSKITKMEAGPTTTPAQPAAFVPASKPRLREFPAPPREIRTTLAADAEPLPSPEEILSMPSLPAFTPASTPPQQIEAGTAIESPPPASSFAGSWVFVPRANDGQVLEYSPEFIEMRVIEESGSLRGHYRARYRVPDRLIPPDISFDFQGPLGTDPPTLNWKSGRGEQGQLHFRRLSERAIEVSWFVTDFGGNQGLGAGRAVLVRRSD